MVKDKEYWPQLAEQYAVNIPSFLSQIAEWQQDPETNDQVYAILDTVVDIFFDSFEEV